MYGDMEHVISSMIYHCEDNSPYHWFYKHCKDGDLDKAKQLHVEGKIDPDSRDGYWLFDDVCTTGDLDAVIWMHANGYGPSDDQGALQSACVSGNIELVRWLCKTFDTEIAPNSIDGWEDVFDALSDNMMHGDCSAIMDMLYNAGGRPGSDNRDAIWMYIEWLEHDRNQANITIENQKKKIRDLRKEVKQLKKDREEEFPENTDEATIQ